MLYSLLWRTLSFPNQGGSGCGAVFFAEYYPTLRERERGGDKKRERERDQEREGERVGDREVLSKSQTGMRERELKLEFKNFIL